MGRGWRPLGSPNVCSGLASPVKHLQAQLAAAELGQRDLAKKVGLKLKPRTPRLIAAALLRDQLAEELDQPLRPVSEAQLAFLEDLEYWAKPADPNPATYAVAYALIEILDARRSLEYLRILKPPAGDIVYLPSSRESRTAGEPLPPDRLRIISSIGKDGTVYFTGGGGAQAPIRAIEVLHSVEDESEEASEMRRTATAKPLVESKRWLASRR
jgi:hypothetical protein